MLREKLWARREAKARAERALADREAQRALSAERDVRRAEVQARHDAEAKTERAARKLAHEAEWEAKRQAEAVAKAHLDERRGYEEVEHELLERMAEADRERARLQAERRATEADRRTTAVQARLTELSRLVAIRPRGLASRRRSVAAAYAAGGAEALAAAVVAGLTATAHPSGLPDAYVASYAPDGRELRVTFELPGRSIVPAVARYEAVESRAAIVPVPRGADEGDALYGRVVAGAAIRVLAGVFDLTPPELVERVRLGADAPVGGRRSIAPGVVVARVPAGGRLVPARLVDVEATRSQAEGLALDSPGFDPAMALVTLAPTPTREPTA